MTTLLNKTFSHGTYSPFGQKGDDSLAFAVPAGEIFDGCVLSVLGKRLNAGASIKSQPSAGQVGPGVVVVHWWFDGGGQIDYRVQIFSRKPNAVSGVSVRVPKFLPSTQGFQFSNSFSKRPDLILKTPFGNLELGDASKGLCGGMVYAVRDYFEARQPIPPGAETPDSGPLFDFIVHRLFDSFDLPNGVLKYMELMHPALPDHETDLSRLQLAPHGRSWRMVVEEWPRIKADLDSGHPCPLGLVCVKSADVTQLGVNHQVMAYGYDLKGFDLTMQIYDPNAPSRDDITLKINLADPEHTKQISYLAKTVYSFFRTKYAFEAPPGYSGAPKIKVSLTARANGKLVCAESAGALPLVANRDRVGSWETFEVCVVGSNRVALKSASNNKFVGVDSTGGLQLLAARSQVGLWETFEIKHLPGNDIALKSVASQKFVCAENAGSKPLVANRDVVGPWETFSLTMV